MSFLLAEHFRLAKQSFRSSRMRTFLTVLGITIGVACVTTILALSDGVLATLRSQTEGTEGSLIVVRPGPAINLSLQTASDPTSTFRFSVSTLRNSDAELIESLSDVKEVSPLMTLIGDTKRSDTVIKNTTVVATNPGLLEFNGFDLNDGEFIDSQGNLNTATIGAQLALDLFGTKSPIGQTFIFKGETFTVTGLLDRVSTPVSVNGFDTDRSVFISLDQGEELINSDAQLQQINVLASASADPKDVAQDITDRLRSSHHGDEDFHVLYGQNIVNSQNALYQSMAGVLIAVASISLVVGGVGIMNIMLVNVSERTREVGLRKAVGASNQNILSQFIIESLGMSLIGGLAGVALGYLAAFIVTIFIPFDPSYTWQVSLLSLGVALTTGVLFGLYPAIKASQKDPIISLRLYR